MRLELVLVLLEFLGIDSVWPAGFDEVEQDLLEDDEENHQSVHAAEGPVPVGQHEQTTEGNDGTHEEGLSNHAVFILGVLAVILTLHDLLDDRTKQLREDGYADGVDESTKQTPPNSFIFLILREIIRVVLHDDCRSRCHNGQRGESNEDKEVRETDTAAPVLDDSLNDLTLPLVVDELRVFLIPLHALLNLLLFLDQTPDVLDRGLLALPRLDVENGPERNEKDVGVVDWRIDIGEVRDEERLTL